MILPTDPVVDFARLHERHYLPLVRLAAQLVDDLDTAEDVVQDVFMALAGQRMPDDPLRYLRTAVVNRARSTLRRRLHITTQGYQLTLDNPVPVAPSASRLPPSPPAEATTTAAHARPTGS